VLTEYSQAEILLCRINAFPPMGSTTWSYGEGLCARLGRILLHVPPTPVSYIALVWEYVNLTANTLTKKTENNKAITLPPMTFTILRTKNGDPITLPLNGDAVRALPIFRARGNGTGRVVRNAAGETLTVTAHWFPEAVRTAGIPPFRWHDVRHTFASRLRQKGVDLATIAALLGHSPKSGFAMTRRYAHQSMGNLHGAVSLISISTTVAPTPDFEVPAFAPIQ
jgi:hypothetical protein